MLLPSLSFSSPAVHGPTISLPDVQESVAKKDKKKKKETNDDDFEQQFEIDDIDVREDEESEEDFDYDDDSECDSDSESIISEPESCSSYHSNFSFCNSTGQIDYLQEEEIRD